MTRLVLRLFAALLLAWALGFALFMVSTGRPLEGNPTDAVVVLTGGPGRIDRGLALLRQGTAKRMLVSGVGRQVKPHELSAQYKIEAGLMRCCIDLGHEAVDTKSNAQETAAWVRKRGYRTVRLVTADWHMPRAELELAAQLGPDVELVGDAVKSGAGPRMATLFKEYHKYLVRRIALWLGGE